MRNYLRLALFVGALGLLAGCQSTGTTSSVSTHIDLSNRSVMAYANGLNSKPVKSSKYRFLVAHSKVKLSCLKPQLTKMMRKVEKHYGKKIVVTSGYRSKSYNRRVNGVRNSQHIYCKAVDIRVPGVSKSALAKYIRTLPGIGGVGVYCRSSYVHMDIGKRRDWYWGCGKSKRRRTARR